MRHTRLAAEPVSLSAAPEDANDAAGEAALAVTVVFTAPVPLLPPWPLAPTSAATSTTVLAPVTAPLRCSLFRASKRRRADTLLPPLLFPRAAVELAPAKADAGLLRDEMVCCCGGGTGECHTLVEECWVPPEMGIGTAVVAIATGTARRMLCSRWRHCEELDDRAGDGADDSPDTS